jgi:hypothetical protein
MIISLPFHFIRATNQPITENSDATDGKRFVMGMRKCEFKGATARLGKRSSMADDAWGDGRNRGAIGVLATARREAAGQT